MNVPLLRKIKKQILAEPSRFTMNYWFCHTGGEPSCGTSGCIAGWACALVLGNKACQALFKLEGIETDPHPFFAAKFLGITQHQAEVLFYADKWPKDFRVAYAEASYAEDYRARIAARRIDHFIKTGK